jgi:hypothetical protein
MDLEADFSRHKLNVDHVTGTYENVIFKYIYSYFSWTHGKKFGIFLLSFLIVLVTKPKCIYITAHGNKNGEKIEKKSVFRIFLWSFILSFGIWFLVKEKFS